jgi:large subunit ribosomal protein L31
MKTDIHPEYGESVVSCACGNTWTTRSTKPQIHLDVCSNCHPFFTGEQRIVDTAGRVERFRRRYAQAEQPDAAKTSNDSVETEAETADAEAT